MSRNLRLMSFAAFTALLPGFALALSLPGPLVSVDWLEAHRAEVNVIDVREDPASFATAPAWTEKDGVRSLETFGGHVPGALLLDFGELRATRSIDGREWKWMLPAQADFQALLQRVGVRQGRPTVIVSDGRSGGDLDAAARLYWSMKVYGDDALAILDGGSMAWLSAGKAVDSAAASADRGDWSASPARTKFVADSNAVAAASSAGVEVVDARPMSFYFGLERKPSVLAAGHVAGALDFPPELRAIQRDGSLHFLSAAQYAYLFPYLGIEAKRPAITYCNTGHLASGAWFVLSEIMGNPDVSLYDGSMYQWTEEGRPLVGLP